MSQFNVPTARRSAGIDVYTGLLGVAAIVLAAGIALMVMKNTDHSASGRGASGGAITLVDAR